MNRTVLLASAAISFVQINPVAAQETPCGGSNPTFVCLEPGSDPIDSPENSASVLILPRATVVSSDSSVPAVALSGNNAKIKNDGVIEQANGNKGGHAITGGGDDLKIENAGTIKSGDRGIEMLAGSSLIVVNEAGAAIETRRQAVRADTDSPGAVVENAGTITSTEDRALQLRSFGARVINSGDLIGAAEPVEARGDFYLENSGTIKLSDPAILDEDGVQLSGGEVQNYGSITGSDDGIDLDEGLIVNHAGGLIKSTAADTNNNGGIDIDEIYDDGVSEERLPTGVTIVNDGTIEGPKGINTDVEAVSSFDLTNRGILNGRGGIAIDLAPGMDDSIVTIDGASEIYGDILFGQGNDTVKVLDLTSDVLSTGIFNGGSGTNSVEFALPLTAFTAFRVEGDRVDLSFSSGQGQILATFVGFENWSIGGQSFDTATLSDSIGNVAGLPVIDETDTLVSATAELEESPTGRPTADMVMVGSDNVGEDLIPLVLGEFAKVLGASSVGGAVEYPDDIAQYIFAYEDGNEFVLEVESTSSGPGLERLIEGTADIAMSSRQANPEEIAAIAAQGRGNLLDVSQEYIVGVDSVLMVVHRDNPVTQLTRAQIAAIYDDEIVNWSEVGGPDLPIVPVARDGGSARENFEVWAYGSARELSPNTVEADRARDMRSLVAGEPGAIGYAISDNAGNTKPIDLILDCGVTTEATPFKSKSEEYLLGRRIRLYTDNQNPIPEVRQFTNMLIDPIVDQYVDKSGYFALSIVEDENALSRLTNAALIGQSGSAGRTAQANIAEQLSDANRLSLTFRFPIGVFSLDSKALRDLDRLVDYMSRPENADREFIFVGFADSLGEFANNDRLSRNRADTVLQQARAHPEGSALLDMSLNATGFGEFAPVGCNEDVQGRAHNRRVEVWVR